MSSDEGAGHTLAMSRVFCFAGIDAKQRIRRAPPYQRRADQHHTYDSPPALEIQSGGDGCEARDNAYCLVHLAYVFLHDLTPELDSFKFNSKRNDSHCRCLCLRQINLQLKKISPQVATAASAEHHSHDLNYAARDINYDATEPVLRDMEKDRWRIVPAVPMCTHYNKVTQMQDQDSTEGPGRCDI